MRILLVEDNRTLAEWIGKTLQRSGYTVEFAYTGVEADHCLLTQTYDLVILDLALPRMPGDEVLRRLRARHNDVPVLILTAADSMEDRVTELNQGADDYMVKPFEVAELEARMRALLRRAKRQHNPLIRCGELAYDSNSREFTLGSNVLLLTPRERAVLEVLIMKAGRTVGKQAIADSLYALNEDVSPDSIEVYVHRLRRKLESGDAVIITLRGLGYLLKPSHGA